MNTKEVVAPLASRDGVRLVRQSAGTWRSSGPKGALLRMPLYYKLIIANAVITLAAVLTCAALVASSVRANAGASTNREVWMIIAIAALLGIVVNSIVVRVALAPVRNLMDAAVAVRAGDDTARAVESPLSDTATADVVTVFNQMLDSLSIYRRQLREIAIRAVDAGEAERTRLSHELHDGIAQGLAAILVQLRVAQRGASPDAQAQLTAIGEQIGASINELRSLAQSLRPPSLDMIGVSAALKSYARNLSSSSGLQIDVTADGIDNALPNEVELTLYRLIQEALQNVAQHAQTRRAVVNVERAGDRIVATVADDGRGFDVQRAMDAGSLGLFGMHERAMYVGGKVEIESAPGRGTIVRVIVPIGEQTHG
jgi:signal transduction histidine kinase